MGIENITELEFAMTKRKDIQVSASMRCFIVKLQLFSVQSIVKAHNIVMIQCIL